MEEGKHSKVVILYNFTSSLLSKIFHWLNFRSTSNQHYWLLWRLGSDLFNLCKLSPVIMNFHSFHHFVDYCLCCDPSLRNSFPTNYNRHLINFKMTAYNRPRSSKDWWLKIILVHMIYDKNTIHPNKKGYISFDFKLFMIASKESIACVWCTRAVDATQIIRYMFKNVLMSLLCLFNVLELIYLFNDNKCHRLN